MAGPGEKPVRWLSPTGLRKTAVVVLQGTVFARYADKREAMGSVPGHLFDLGAEVAESANDHAYEDGAERPADVDMHLDYVSDIGDGFNATYAVACSITDVADVVGDIAPGHFAELPGNCGCSRPEGTRPLLVFGGDEVYPVASVKEYRTRTAYPYGLAAKAAGLETREERDPKARRPYVAALPGNHDWYDGLVAFRRIFCESWTLNAPRAADSMDIPHQRELDNFEAWQAFQERSYFAIRLSHGWWLWGIDSQLDAPIDAVQLAYFKAAYEALRDTDDRVILCTAKPSWIDDHRRDDPDDYGDRQTLAFFLAQFFGRSEGLARVRLLLSGDKHHYVRYTPVVPSATFSPELVTCGGGGAYLSSTHHFEDADDTRPGSGLLDAFGFEKSTGLTLPALAEGLTKGPGALFRKAASFPPGRESKRLRRGFWMIPIRNGTLPLFVAALYGLVAWSLSAGDGWKGWPVSVRGLLLGSLLCLALGFYARSSAKRPTWSALAFGFGHGLMHVAAASVVALLVGKIAQTWWPETVSKGNLWVCAVVVVATIVLLILAGCIGAMLFAVNLVVGDHLPNHLHDNELFAGMRIEGYKSHLRIHVAPDGLHVRAIGIRKTAARWTERHTPVERPHRADRGGPVLRAAQRSPGPRSRPHGPALTVGVTFSRGGRKGCASNAGTSSRRYVVAGGRTDLTSCDRRRAGSGSVVGLRGRRSRPAPPRRRRRWTTPYAWCWRP